MRDVVEEIRARGAELVVVGCGNPKQAAAFRSDLGIDFPLLVDTRREAYKAAAFHRGIGATFSPRAMGHGLRALRGGFRQKGVQGDPWQQGGAFVIAQGGEVLYAYRSREAGDHPDPRELVRALG